MSAYATIIDDIMYIGGGECPDYNDDYYIFMYHLNENKWTRLPTRLPQCNGVVINISNKLTVIGGIDYTTSHPTNKVLTLQDNHWTSLCGYMNSARNWPAVLPHHQYTIVAGGEGGKGEIVLDTIEVFDGNQWTISIARLPKPMWSINATTCDNSLIIAGFFDADGYSNSEVYIAMIDDITATDISSSSSADYANNWTILAPTPCWNNTIVPYTTPAVIVGGRDKYGTTTDEVMAYNDSNNSWMSVSLLPLKCCKTTILKLPYSIIMAGGCTDNRTLETRKASCLNNVMIGELVECD